MGKIPAILLAMAAAGCSFGYEPGDRPFEAVDEFPGLIHPAHAGFRVVAVKGGEILVVERISGQGGGPFEEELRLREAAGAPPWKRVGDGKYEIGLFGIRIPRFADEMNGRSGDDAAEQFLRGFVLGREVALVWAPAYGQAYVFVQETIRDPETTISTSTMVNLELVINGFALTDAAGFRNRPGNWRLREDYETFKKAESEARSRKLGLWRFTP